MAKLTPLKPAEVMRKLRLLGFVGPYPGGKHQRMVHSESGVIIPIPVHKGTDVSVGLVRQIMREARVDREQWIGL